MTKMGQIWAKNEPKIGKKGQRIGPKILNCAKFTVSITLLQKLAFFIDYQCLAYVLKICDEKSTRLQVVVYGIECIFKNGLPKGCFSTENTSFK